MRIIRQWFWAFCVIAALVGLFLPAVGAPIGRVLKFMLGSILFFTGLRLDFSAAFHELIRPRMVAYLSVMRLIVLPPIVYFFARLVLPEPFAVGVLIVAAMPAGTAGSALADIVHGNPALALVGTLVTSMLCPLVTPWVIALCSGYAIEGGAAFLLHQAVFLALILFVPLGAALAVRRAFPAQVKRRRGLWAVLAMISLFLLICGALSTVSADFKELLWNEPWLALGLCLFMCCFSAGLHVVGYLMAPWRPVRDRAALSVNTAYVNNGLGIVFAAQFFSVDPRLGAAAVLPAILLEIPMALALVPLKAFVAGRLKKAQAEAAEQLNLPA